MIEDPGELVCANPRQVRYPVSQDLSTVRQMRRATRDGADWLIVGELRRAEDVVEFLRCAAFGLSGATTVYASSATALQERLEGLMIRAGCTSGEARGYIRHIDLVVWMGEGDGRAGVLDIAPMVRPG